MQTFAHAPTPAFPMPLPDGAPPLPEREEVGLRLRRARKEAGIETAQAAEMGGFSVAQLGNIERGTHSLTSVGTGHLARLPAAFGLTWEQFVEIISPAYGAYIPFLTRPPDPRPHAQDGAVRLIGDGLAELPVYGLAAAHADGNMTAERPLGIARVPARYARGQMHAYAVLGDSMDDGTRAGICDGDVVICNHADTDLSEGKIYVVKVPGNGILLKRVRRYEDGELYLASDNPKYRNLAPEDAQVIGRVVWIAPQGYAP